MKDPGGYCPFCIKPVLVVSGYHKPGETPADYADACCVEDHRFKWGDRLLELNTPRIPGWVFTNMQSATNLGQGVYLYRPDWSEYGEDSIAGELEDYWSANTYRRFTVYWKINAPVPVTAMQKIMRALEARMQLMAEEFGVHSAQMREYYPYG